MSKEYKRGTIVTVPLDDPKGSNTFLVEQDLGDVVLLTHPLAPECFVKYPKNVLNIAQANLKDSSERALDFAKSNAEYLDYQTRNDLRGLCVFFVVYRRMTKTQKRALSAICGRISRILLNDDVNLAINLIKENGAILDNFNAKWVSGFEESGLLSGKWKYLTPKQEMSLFNIAGFILAELEIPSAKRNLDE